MLKMISFMFVVICASNFHENNAKCVLLDDFFLLHSAEILSLVEYKYHQLVGHAVVVIMWAIQHDMFD